MITLEKYKDQIDAYFENTPPSEIIKRFEELGYEFEPIDAENETNDLSLQKVNQELVNGNQETTELKKELHQIIDKLQDEDVLECVYKVVQTFQMKTSL